MGIDPVIVKWIKEWLSGQKKRVVINGAESDWTELDCGVPQGSVLGPILFLIYVNDLDEGLQCMLLKFADHTKLMTKISRVEDCIKLQKDLDRVLTWCETNDMELNSEKCSVMKIGNKNFPFNYEIKDKSLKVCEHEKDLGVIINNNLKSKIQCLEAAKKANRMLGMIKRNVKYKCKDIIIPLYNAYVRPQLEYCLQAWCPYQVGDLNKLENVQRRATKLIPGIRNKTYEERLKYLKLFSIKRRAIRGDLIQMFKFVKNIDKIDLDKFFEFDKNPICRGHSFKIKKKYSRTDIRKYSFSQRIVDHWNKLPLVLVENCETVETFKKNLDIYMNLNDEDWM